MFLLSCQLHCRQEILHFRHHQSYFGHWSTWLFGFLLKVDMAYFFTFSNISSVNSNISLNFSLPHQISPNPIWCQICVKVLNLGPPAFSNSSNTRKMNLSISSSNPTRIDC